MRRIDRYLEEMLEKGASDIHLSSNHQPCYRVDGEMQFQRGTEKFTDEELRELIYEFAPQRNIAELEEDWDTDFAYELPGAARFRVNVFIDHEGIGCVMRQIPSRVPTFEELNIPEGVRSFCFLNKGLVIVTGPTGSGKSTTLAAMVDLINRTRRQHLITVEDPVEFKHRSLGCLVNQREVHVHTKNFSSALRAALREDPDIVLVGELRDLETMEIAIETAETGHLVFGTLHTNTAATTVDRIIDKFPADRQNQIRTMLADSLKGVIAQTLCKRIGGGRIASCEILVATPAVAANIREGKTHQIPSLMQTGKNVGMCTFADDLLSLVKRGIITPEEAYSNAIDKAFLQKKFEEENIRLDLSVSSLDDLEMHADETENASKSEKALKKLHVNPHDTDALRELITILATDENPDERNGVEALEYAQKLLDLTGQNEVTTLVLISAAYAELSHFGEAVEWSKRAAKVAKANKQKDLLAGITRQSNLFKRGIPLRGESL
ncbi:type IV pilus twitching motility protein PilT [Pontiella agarivorans]|uniref:Type IV pilus twitching motility protein PilT n=1 Tax=Pontiella agarivorans TaxID=3038953 RepID=A0ABU5N1I1_9BACT|nr:type IV pilus twitching motility protein PilT [Pontiella agarivorans]MDZ8120282.1 type IV pilus twitching motility protein PilT [Pontiella agarivorans]